MNCKDTLHTAYQQIFSNCERVNQLLHLVLN